MLIKIDMIHEIMKEISNMIKKKIDLSFVRDEILERKVVIYIIKYIKKIYLYLISIQFMVRDLVHIVRMTIHLIDICL